MGLVITQKEIHDLAVSKGWWESFPNPLDRLPTSLMLMVSELAECLEEYREGRGATEIYYEYSDGTKGTESFKASNRLGSLRGKPSGIPIELADAAIRIRDTAEALGFDLEEMIEQKHKFNKTRPYQHGNKRA